MLLNKIRIIFVSSFLLFPGIADASHESHVVKSKQMHSETEYDDLNKIAHPDTSPLHPECTLQKEVFGFHPYWYGTSYKSYDFHALSHVSYFTLHIDPKTGHIETPNLWTTTPLVELAKSSQTTVGVTIANFGPRENNDFLSNAQAQAVFIKEVEETLADRGAASLTIDFEGVAQVDKENFSGFIEKLHGALSSKNNNFRVNLTLPAIDWNNVYDIERIQPFIHRFILMAYDYHNAQSHYAGPVAPLASGEHWPRFNIENSIKKYLGGGMDKTKLLLSVPYYGQSWKTDSDKIHSRNIEPRGPITYRSFKAHVSSLDAKWDDGSKSFFALRKKDNEVDQIWIENQQSLGLKYDHVLKEGLAGIAIFALGYDNTHPELWELIRTKFSTCE